MQTTECLEIYIYPCGWKRRPSILLWMYMNTVGGTRTLWTFSGCSRWGTNIWPPSTSACASPTSSGAGTSTTGWTWTCRSDPGVQSWSRNRSRQEYQECGHSTTERPWNWSQKSCHVTKCTYLFFFTHKLSLNVEMRNSPGELFSWWWSSAQVSAFFHS